MTPVVRITNCTLLRPPNRSSDPPRRVLDGISVDLHRKEWTVLTGPSGGGKTTLAWIVAGLLRATAGSVTYDGQRHPPRGSIQMVFQDPYSALNPLWTLDRWLGDALIGADWKERSRELCANLRLPDTVFQRRPLDLSGGECQRACLLSALMHDPDLLILDEPFSMVDDETRGLMLEVVERRHQASDLSILMISHDLKERSRFESRSVLLEAGKLNVLSRE